MPQSLQAHHAHGSIYRRLEIEESPDASRYEIRIGGELDLAGCPALESALVKAERSEAELILVDLEELMFADAAGLRVLCEAGDRSASNGNRLRVTPGQGQVARVFHLTALDEVLPFTYGGGRNGASPSTA